MAKETLKMPSSKDLEMGRLSWISQEGPKQDYEGPCKSEARGQKRERGLVTAEAGIGVGVLWPPAQAEECWQPLETESDKGQTLCLQKEPVLLTL